MGLWKEIYIEKKDNEPQYMGSGRGQYREWKCRGVLDKQGKCKNVIKSSFPRFFCDDCIDYFMKRNK